MRQGAANAITAASFFAKKAGLVTRLSDSAINVLKLSSA
jgi:hypothetical protein